MCLARLKPARTVEHGFYAVKVFRPASKGVLWSFYLPTQRTQQNPYGDQGDLLQYEIGALTFSPMPDTPGMYCYYNRTFSYSTDCQYIIYIPPGATIRKGFDVCIPAFLTDMLFVCERI